MRMMKSSLSEYQQDSKQMQYSKRARYDMMVKYPGKIHPAVDVSIKPYICQYTQPSLSSKLKEEISKQERRRYS